MSTATEKLVHSLKKKLSEHPNHSDHEVTNAFLDTFSDIVQKQEDASKRIAQKRQEFENDKKALKTHFNPRTYLNSKR